MVQEGVVHRDRVGQDSSNEFRIITSLRLVLGEHNHLIDADHIISYHRDRLLAATKAFGWTEAASCLKDPILKLIEEAVSGHSPKSLPYPSTIAVYKVRVQLDSKGKVFIDSSVISQYPADSYQLGHLIPDTLHQPNNISQRNCKVLLDIQPTQSSLFTKHKTTLRSPYDQARLRLGISQAGPLDAEVLLFNTQMEIMEASLCTIYFYRGQRWITPHENCGGNLGVTRRLALEKGLCVEGTIKVNEIIQGEKVWLSNAVRGFFIGRIHLNNGAL